MSWYTIKPRNHEYKWIHMPLDIEPKNLEELVCH